MTCQCSKLIAFLDIVKKIRNYFNFYKIFSYERVKLKAETMDHNPVNINQTKFIFDKNRNKSVPRLF